MMARMDDLSSGLRLTPPERVSSPQDVPRPAPGGVPFMSHVQAPLFPQLLWRRLTGAQPQAPSWPGNLSVQRAYRELTQDGVQLPSMASGSASAYVKSILAHLPSAERASIVAAARFLLRKATGSLVYQAVLQHLLMCTLEDRIPLAMSAGPLVKTMVLHDAADAHEFIAMLRVLGKIAPHRREELVNACRGVQMYWDHDVSGAMWSNCLRILETVSSDALPSFVRDAHEMFADQVTTDGATAAFFACLALYAALDVGARAEVRAEVHDLDLLAARHDWYPETPRSRPETMQQFLVESPAARAHVVTVCRDIFGGSAAQPDEKARVAYALLTAPLTERAPLAAIFADLRQSGVALLALTVDDVKKYVLRALRDSVERAQILAGARNVFSGTTPPVRSPLLWMVIRTLAQIPASERDDAAELMGCTHRQGYLLNVGLLADILESTPAIRRARIDFLNTPQNGPGRRVYVGGTHDTESVMQASLSRASQKAVARLRQAFPARLSVAHALREINTYIEHLTRALQSQPEHLLWRSRGGAPELANARRTLVGATVHGDLSHAICKTPDMAELCALVWHATGAPRPGVAQADAIQDTQNMRHSFLLALAACIEDDGHRVCGVGQRQYLLAVLKGYYPEAGNALDDVTPASVLAALAEEFSKTLGDRHKPSAAQITDFVRNACQVAAEYFAAHSSDLQRFHDDLTEYVAYTY